MNIAIFLKILRETQKEWAENNAAHYHYYNDRRDAEEVVADFIECLTHQLEEENRFQYKNNL